MSLESIQWLQQWFGQQADGAWEHSFGVKIQTLDNPGWVIMIDLNETQFEQVAFKEVRRNMDDSDWLRCRVVGSRFEAYCGPSSLHDAINEFRVWVEAAAKQRHLKGTLLDS